MNFIGLILILLIIVFIMVLVFDMFFVLFKTMDKKRDFLLSEETATVTFLKKVSSTMGELPISFMTMNPGIYFASKALAGKTYFVEFKKGKDDIKVAQVSKRGYESFKENSEAKVRIKIYEQITLIPIFVMLASGRFNRHEVSQYRVIEVL